MGGASATGGKYLYQRWVVLHTSGRGATQVPRSRLALMRRCFALGERRCSVFELELESMATQWEFCQRKLGRATCAAPTQLLLGRHLTLARPKSQRTRCARRYVAAADCAYLCVSVSHNNGATTESFLSYMMYLNVHWVKELLCTVVHTTGARLHASSDPVPEPEQGPCRSGDPSRAS